MSFLGVSGNRREKEKREDSMREMLFNLSGFAQASEVKEILRKKKRIEPKSVLDQRSPSPQTSSSTGGGSTNSAGLSTPWPPIPPEQAPFRHECASELPPIPSSLEIAPLDWDEMLPDPPFLGFENLPAIFPPPFPGISFLNPNPIPLSGDFPLAPHLLNPNLLPPPNPNPQTSVVEELVNAAAMIESGGFSSACAILARLNHPLSSGKSMARAALYCREALLRIAGGAAAAPPSSPADFVFKLAARKSFSELSPVLPFCHFSTHQLVLEETLQFDRIHIVDFDIGDGSQWSSLMQELSQKKSTLRITALASPESEPFELALTKESLRNFAGDLGLPFEVNVVSGDFERLTLGDEAVVVNLPSRSTTGGALRLAKRLKPRVVVSVDFFGGGESPLPRRVIQSVESAAGMMDSMEAAGVDLDSLMKIEEHVVKERIEREMAAAPARTEDPAAAGFSPVVFSGFAEIQADRLIKKSRLRGFHVEKMEGALTLCWQRRKIVSVAAWR